MVSKLPVEHGAQQLAQYTHLHLQFFLAVLQPLQSAFTDKFGDIILIFRQPVQCKSCIVLKIVVF